MFPPQLNPMQLDPILLLLLERLAQLQVVGGGDTAPRAEHSPASGDRDSLPGQHAPLESSLRCRDVADNIGLT